MAPRKKKTKTLDEFEEKHPEAPAPVEAQPEAQEAPAEAFPGDALTSAEAALDAEADAAFAEGGEVAETPPAPTPGSQITVKSVKYRQGVVEIHAEERVVETDWRKDISLRSAEDPGPDFRASFASLAGPFRQIWGVPDSWCREGIEITGITISESKGHPGATITAKAQLEACDLPANPVTPYLPFTSENEGGNRALMPAAAVSAIRAIERHALDYLSGNRAQQKLPL